MYIFAIRKKNEKLGIKNEIMYSSTFEEEKN